MYSYTKTDPVLGRVKLTVYGSAYIDWGVCVEIPRFNVCASNPHLLSADSYGTHGNGRAWGRRAWRETLAREFWDLTELLAPNTVSAASIRSYAR